MYKAGALGLHIPQTSGLLKRHSFELENQAFIGMLIRSIAFILLYLTNNGK